MAGTAAGLGIKGFASVNLVLTLVWLALAAGILREHRRRARQIDLSATVHSPVVAATTVARPAGA
jgi:hypothetical protein